MLNFKALSLAIAMLIPTTMSNVYSFKQGKFLNHSFIEVEKGDDLFDFKFENYSKLPDVGEEHVIYILGKKLEKRRIEHAKNNNYRLIVFDSDSRNYSVWYSFKFSNDQKYCFIDYIKGLCNQHAIKNINEIDPSIFVYPFMYNDNLKYLYLDVSYFSEQDKKKLKEMGFEQDSVPLGMTSLTMNYDKFLKYRNNVIYGGRT